MSVALLVPDGVSLRNFVLCGVAERLAATRTVDLLVAPALRRRAADAGGIRHVAELAPYPERPMEAAVRRTLEYSHLRACNTNGTRFALEQPIPGRRRERLLRRAAKAGSLPLGSARAVVGQTRVHDAIARRRPEVAPYDELLREWGSTFVLCAHQRPTIVLPVVLAAQQLGIPTATFIFSWDNLTTKGRIAAPFDHFFVWSDQMAEELGRFYPDVDPSRIHVVGSPQFEPYADGSLDWGRSRFHKALGLQADRPVICYSGGDTRTCPDDPAHVALVCDLIEQGRIAGDPQLIVRPAPVDVSGRYDVIAQRRNVVMAQPEWTAEGDDWSSIAPTPSDVEMLVNLTHYADLNINMASTMTLDFALNDTPVVNIGFDLGPDRRLAERYYRFDHYRPVVELGAARVARTPDELADHVNAYLADPALDADRRRAFVDFELRVRPGESAGEIGQVVDDLSTRPPIARSVG